MRSAAVALAVLARTVVRRHPRFDVRVSKAGAGCVCGHPRAEPLEREETERYSEQKACGDRLHGAILQGGDQMPSATPWADRLSNNP